ncbi:MAG: DUF3995 domain-containing protein [Bacteroidetes bacterium]|nr:DUF3995 domain-containing protein [Bacteroidota bacterium]NCQ11704.1 DUF3995 domain-containing protein [Bacteroidota bacterium]
MILSILLSLIFFGLAILHFTWVFGGKTGFIESLPTNENGIRVLNPTKLDSAIVGIGLTFFGLFYVFHLGLIYFKLPYWMHISGLWIIPIIFIVRAIGDFKYVGFFKRIRKTNFAKLDTKYFSPLCFGIGVTGMIILYLK